MIRIRSWEGGYVTPKTSTLHTNKQEYRPAVMMDDVFLEEDESVKFLGMYLDRGLTWDFHIDSICSKDASGIYVFAELGLLTLHCLYIDFRIVHHRTTAFEHLPSQVGVKLINKLLEGIKHFSDSKQVKSRLEHLLVSTAFYSVERFEGLLGLKLLRTIEKQQYNKPPVLVYN
ncbi:hypothetical protein J6590_055810 [Homalodisca vitripennis]|nr:hypothetical protein J6590_055810 [Homalodisca vitripennis]